MEKYWRTLLNRKERVLRKVADLYYWLEHCQWDMDTYLAERDKRIFKTGDWERLPRYMKSYVNGNMDLRFHMHQRSLLWCLEWDGKNITSKEWEELFPGKDNRPPWKDGDKIRWGHCYPDTRKPFDGMRYPHEDRI